MNMGPLKKIRENTLFAGTAIYLFSNVINSAIPFALLPVLTRFLSPEEYGRVAMFQTLVGALMAFIGLSMHGASGRKFYESGHSREELAEFIGSCIQILLFTATVTFLILLLFENNISSWVGLDRKWVFFAVAVTTANVIIQLRLGQWQVRKKAKYFGVFQVSQSVLNIAISLFLVTVLMLGAEGRISSVILASGVFAMLALALLSRDRLLHVAVWRPDYIKEILKFGVPLVPHVAGLFLLASVDRFVINDRLGLANAGVYMVAVQFSMAVSLVFDAINKAYVPWLYERLKENDDRKMRDIVRFTYIWFVVILSGAGLAFLVGPYLVVFVAGENYSEAGSVIGWLVLGQVFGGMYLMVTNYIFYSKRTGLLSLATIFSGAVNVGLLFILIKMFGLRGAAYSFCVAMGLRFVLTWWIAQLRHPMPWFGRAVQGSGESE